tara:strand:+ start:52 stop:384 length:333 start_codon:yes stop_codon:yes gene_type:complete
MDNMKGAMGNLMKQAQKMQEDVQRVQQEIAETQVTGESGAGMVKVVMDGRHDVRGVALDPLLMSEDKAMLEDLLAAAVNDANRRVELMTKEKMGSVTAGIPLPPGIKLPF